MIALLMALAVQQTLGPPVITSAYPRPADLPALVTARIKGCVAVQIALESNPDIHPPTMLRDGEALDGSQVQSRMGRGFCQILGSEWRGDGEIMASAVRLGLEDLPTPVVIAQWREPMANERGPSLWTTFERKDAEGRTIAVVRLIEPIDGATSEVDITYETPPH